MPPVQIRNLPDEQHAKLRERAASRGQSIAEYVRELIARDLALPTVNEFNAELAEDDPVDLDRAFIVDLIRERRGPLPG